MIMIFKWLTNNRKTRQYLAGISCCLTNAMAFSSTAWPSSSMPKMFRERQYLHLTADEITWMVASLYLGNLISPIPCSYLMDRFGRKTTLICATMFTIISWAILFFPTAPYQMYIARFLSGMANSVTYTITPIYIAEIAEPGIRGSVNNMAAILGNLGTVYLTSIALYTNYEGLTIAALFIPVLFLLTFTWVPESPYYHVMRNDNERAIRSLIWFRCDKTDDEIIKELNVVDTYVKEQMKNKSRFVDLVRSEGNRKALIITMFLSALQRFAGTGVLMTYGSITIPENSFSFLTVGQCVTLLAVAWFITPVISSPFIDRFGRRTLLIISSLGCSLTTLLASLWFYFDEKTTGFESVVSSYMWVPFVSFLLHAEFQAAGIGPFATSICGELFPSNIKGKASAVSSITLALVSFFLNKFYVIITDVYGMYLNFAIFSTFCFLSAFFVYFYLVETKGKTLEEIQDELNKVDRNEKNAKE